MWKRILSAILLAAISLAVLLFPLGNFYRSPLMWARSGTAPDKPVDLFLVGATAVSVGAACFADPYAPVKTVDELAQIAAEQGLSQVSQLTGAVRPW